VTFAELVEEPVAPVAEEPLAEAEAAAPVDPETDIVGLAVVLAFTSEKARVVAPKLQG
jgi:hypothetical protein